MRSLSLTINEEVEAALHDGHGVVALESTIITHGMPYPQNRETALMVEQAVRDHGAVPATIAILNGELCVGLKPDQLDALSTCQGAMKLSRSDLAMALSQRAMGSTTVAATMIVAKLAGIAVFATGGIGGVHQGAEQSFDISADLYELHKTEVTVVCAGAKAILDIPKTLEVLETLGVPVITLGQDEFPAFWSRNSGLQSPLRVDSISDIVAFLQARQTLQLDGGVLIANPVPGNDEIAYEQMKAHITDAIQAADAAGIRGKAVTPWLLSRIVELSDGKSLATNQSLIKDNARVAAQLAVALTRQHA